MIDSRLTTLAENITGYALSLEKGEKVLINANGSACEPLVLALVAAVYNAQALPFVSYQNERIERAVLKGIHPEQLKIMAEADLLRMREMDAYIGIGAGENSTAFSDVPSDKMNLYMEQYMTPVHGQERVKNTKWVVLRYPTNSMAQAAAMSLEGFEEFYFQVCNLDYRKMSLAMDHLVRLMESTDKVRINGPGTDIEFSIKGMAAIKCDGKINIPDGEVFTAPIKESVNGTLSYNCPAVYQGVTYDNICFEFRDGKIVKAQANNTERINQVLDTDEGARYIGEFALGVNPYIENPMKNTLFDEKIKGSFHFTPGRCYDEADNGNVSAIHWDLVVIQTENFGGGNIYFDDTLIRENGLFVHPDLKKLNPRDLV